MEDYIRFPTIYPMQKGMAIIFNHNAFDDSGLKEREGTKKDREDIKKCLEGLSFNVTIYNDLSAEQIKKELKKVAGKNHKGTGCLLIVVMTHGSCNDELHARDDKYYVSDLWEPFTADNCKGLAGKPKLFFLQACRGKENDLGSSLYSSVNSVENDVNQRRTQHIVKIPTTADFLIMHATFNDFTACRNKHTGSWFIQSLCAELNLNGKRQDLMNILTNVIRRVAFLYENDTGAGGTKQCPNYFSTLTKKLYFNGFLN